MTACPSASARTITSSLISWAPDSTMTMASSVPATSRFSLLFVRRSPELGLTTTCSSQYPTRTAPTGLWNGIDDRVSAVDAPMMASVSESFSMSAERRRPMTWVSLL